MRCTLQDILFVVARDYDLTPEQLLERTRRIPIAKPRQVAMWIAREVTKLSLPDIGTRLGGFDHSTVMYGVRITAENMKEDAEFADRVHRLSRAATARAAARSSALGRGRRTDELTAPA